jgi:hypothetical protein
VDRAVGRSVGRVGAAGLLVGVRSCGCGCGWWWWV